MILQLNLPYSLCTWSNISFFFFKHVDQTNLENFRSKIVSEHRHIDPLTYIVGYKKYPFFFYLNQHQKF